MTLLIDILGWIGMILLVSGYYLVSAGKLPGPSRSFQYMNIVGAILVGLNAGYHGAYPSCAINVVWLVIGVLTVAGVMRVTPAQSTEVDA